MIRSHLSHESQVDTASDGLSSVSEGDLSEGNGGNGWGGLVFGALRSLKDWDSIGFNGSLMGFNVLFVEFNGTLVGFSGSFMGFNGTFYGILWNSIKFNRIRWDST